jgi:hypothetical protein
MGCGRRTNFEKVFGLAMVNFLVIYLLKRSARVESYLSLNLSLKLLNLVFFPRNRNRNEIDPIGQLMVN